MSLNMLYGIGVPCAFNLYINKYLQSLLRTDVYKHPTSSSIYVNSILFLSAISQCIAIKYYFYSDYPSNHLDGKVPVALGQGRVRGEVSGLEPLIQKS